MEPRISLCMDGRTDIGNRRPNNEDAWWAGQAGGPAFFMVPGPEPLVLEPDRAPALIIVSDGIGGSNAGEVASRMAVQAISGALGRGLAAPAGTPDPQRAVLAAMDIADKAIKAKALEPGFDGMGATVSLLWLTGGGAFWGQAGDSRIYLCRSGKLRQISQDHSPVDRMRRRGEITEAEARRHPERNRIDQSLGNPDVPFQPEAGTADVLPGDVFLVCSDGINDGLWDREIEEVLAGVRSPAGVRPAVNRLVDGAKKASGRDNITAVVAFAGKLQAPGAPEPGRSLWRRLLRR
jgi:protein phosphatase